MSFDTQPYINSATRNWQERERELLEANNRELERRRVAEQLLANVRTYVDNVVMLCYKDTTNPYTSVDRIKAALLELQNKLKSPPAPTTHS